MMSLPRSYLRQGAAWHSIALRGVLGGNESAGGACWAQALACRHTGGDGPASNVLRQGREVVSTSKLLPNILQLQKQSLQQQALRPPTHHSPRTSSRRRKRSSSGRISMNCAMSLFTTERPPTCGMDGLTAQEVKVSEQMVPSHSKAVAWKHPNAASRLAARTSVLSRRAPAGTLRLYNHAHM